MISNNVWSEVYRPERLNELYGQDDAVSQLVSCVKEKKPCLLHGPVGSGKTSAVYALAKERGYELVELHSYDWSDKEGVSKMVKGVLCQGSLWGNEKILFVDDVDGISSAADRGIISVVTSVMEEVLGKHAVVFAAIDPWESSLQTVRKKCKMINFKKVLPQAVKKALQRAAEKEKLQISSEILDFLSRQCQGDVRAALTDLQLITTSNKNITKESLNNLYEREREQSIFNGLQTLFKSKDPHILGKAFEAVDADWDELFLWIDENLPKEYQGKSLGRAYEMMSKADVFRGRIRRWQYWRFLVYIQSLLTVGVGLAKEEAYKAYIGYQRNQRIWKWYASQQKKKQKLAAVERILTITGMHLSPAKGMKEVLPYLPFLLRNASEDLFSEEDIELLK